MHACYNVLSAEAGTWDQIPPKDNSQLCRSGTFLISLVIRLHTLSKEAIVMQFHELDYLDA